MVEYNVTKKTDILNLANTEINVYVELDKTSYKT